MKPLRLLNLLAFTLIAGIMCVSCATTHQTRSVETSGFLGDYSQLKEGKGDQALLVYIDEDVNFDAYEKILIDPVRLIATEGSDLAEIDKEDAQAVADYFYVALNQQLSKNYTIVKEPGPGTMHLKVALTDMTGSKVVLDTLSSLIPVGVAGNLISKVATGNNTAGGSATGEMSKRKI